MNILFSPAHYFVSDKLGSEASWAYYAMEALAASGHKVYAICGLSDLSRPLHENIKLITLFGEARDRNALVEYRRKLIFYRRVAALSREILKTESIDIVHHFAPISPQSPNLLVTRGKLKQPFTMGPGMGPARKGEDLDIAMGVKKDWKFYLVKAGIDLISGAAFRLHKRTLDHTDHLFACTTEAAEYFSTLMPKKKISVVPAGIDVCRYTLKESAVARNPQIILALCYLIKRKGLDVLLTAFARIKRYHPKARIWIVGNGPEEENLKRLAKELKIEGQVRFWGFVDNKQVAKYYAEAGIFVSPTRNEPFGQTFLEAMAAGLPIVASKTGGIPDIVTSNVGFTHPVDDDQALATILDKLLRNPKEIEKLGLAARERVVDHYDWSVIMRQYVETWEKLLNR